MLLHTVLALASLVSADGGYHYDVPRVPFNLPNNPLTNLQATPTSQSAGTVVTGDHPENSVSYTLLLDANSKAHLSQSLNNNNLQTISAGVGATVNSGLNPLNSLNTIPISNHNPIKYVNNNIRNTLCNINSGFGQDKNLIASANINNGASNAVLHNIVSNALVNTNVNSGNANVVSHKASRDFRNGPVQHINQIMSGNVNNAPNNIVTSIPFQNINQGVVSNLNSIDINVINRYAELGSSITGAQTFGVNLNNGYANSVQSNLEGDFNSANLPTINHLSNGNTHGFVNGNLNSVGSFSQNNNGDAAQIYTDFAQKVNSPIGVKHNNAITQNLIPLLETSRNTGDLPLQSLNNVNTNTFPPTGSVESNNGITHQLTPISNNAIIINNGISSFDITNGASAPAAAPIITKSIYFHVPPPDIEEPTGIIPPPPPKKTYKILFIKVPSQDSANSARLQQLAQQQAQVDVKTLIYVLVKKPEPQIPVVASKITKSNHEVFFVKYNSSPDGIASQINDVLAVTPGFQNTGPLLQPGLANGQTYDHVRGDQGAY